MNMLGLSNENVQAQSKRLSLLVSPTKYAYFRIYAVRADREGQNNKELTVRRGELIEIETSSKKWWRAKNFRGDVGHVPHNLVEEIDIEQRISVCINLSWIFPNLYICYIEEHVCFLVCFFHFRNLSHRIHQV